MRPFVFFGYKRIWHLLRERLYLSPEPAPELEDRPQSLLHGKAAGCWCVRDVRSHWRNLSKRFAPPEQRTFASSRSTCRIAVRLEAAIASLPAEWSEIDVLVNNAGLSRGLTKLYEDDPQNWEEMIDTNVKGLLYVTRCVVPGMVARARGHVINLGSTAAYITYANGAVYCASKAAEEGDQRGAEDRSDGDTSAGDLSRPRNGGDELQRGTISRG